MGWKRVGTLPDLRGLVVVVAPHTSNWDFLIGILNAYALGVRRRWRFRFLAQDSLFVWPIGPLFRRLRGGPEAPAGAHAQRVDRKSTRLHFHSRSTPYA